MYLRHTTIRKSGKVHTYWRLVRSVRMGRRVVQQTVATLGELDSEGRAKARALAESFGARRPGPGLFEPRAAAPVPVLLDRVRLERPRQFGATWLGWVLWRALRLEELFERLLPAGREEVGWAQMAAVQVVARLCEPSSDLHIAEDWYRKSALEDILGIPAEKVNEDRLYRVLDRMLPHKEAIERHLRARLGELFRVEFDLLLYDITSIYFEGEAKGNSLALRGHSSDHRPDCKQVLLALVVTREGLPLGYEIFAGNRVGVTTVEEIVTTMEQRHGRADRIWVMDRGMVSEENLEWLREGERRYLLGGQRTELRRFARELADARDWKGVREGLEVKLVRGPDGGETFVLCRSEERREKERAMHERFSSRIVERLESLASRLESARRRVDRDAVHLQIGRILQANSRAAKKFRVSVRRRRDRPSGLELHWEEDARWNEWASLTEGAYVLRTNIPDWTPEELWKTYVQLTDAEAAFRVHKSQLSIRPVFHHRAERVCGHILVCFLAYVLWKTLEQWQARAGLGNSPRTVIDELKAVQSADVVLPTADGRELRIRCVVRPDRAQTLLLARLGIDLPRRLRLQPGLEM